MCDFIDRLINYLKPIIVDIDAQKKELDKQKKLNETIKSFVLFVDKDIKKIKDFPDQEFVISNLENCGSNKKEYDAMVYLMSSNDDSVQNLPQFSVALDYMEKIWNYFVVLKDVLSFRVYELENIYHSKYIANKYYKVFLEQHPYVSNATEFYSFINGLSISDQDKIDILSYTISKNVEYYGIDNDELPKLEIDPKQDLMKIQELIYQDKDILSADYMELYDLVSKYIDLKRDIKDITTDKVIKKINITNILLAKRIWLMKEITSNYKSCEFAKLSKYVSEYNRLMDIEKRSAGKSSDEIVKIVRGEY